jgi:hypothetical protein
MPVLTKPLSFLSLEKGGNRKTSYFLSTNAILHYVPIHSLDGISITSLPFIVTCCELDTDSVVFGQGYVVLVMWGLFSSSATKYLKQHQIISAIIVLCGHANKSES